MTATITTHLIQCGVVYVVWAWVAVLTALLL